MFTQLTSCPFGPVYKAFCSLLKGTFLYLALKDWNLLVKDHFQSDSERASGGGNFIWM